MTVAYTSPYFDVGSDDIEKLRAGVVQFWLDRRGLGISWVFNGGVPSIVSKDIIIVFGRVSVSPWV